MNTCLNFKRGTAWTGPNLLYVSFALLLIRLYGKSIPNPHFFKRKSRDIIFVSQFCHNYEVTKL